MDAPEVSPEPTDDGAGLAAIRVEIARAAVNAGRDPSAVSLIAVSKTQTRGAVETLLGCGQMIFGENRVQEAQGKFPELRSLHPALRLHLIGPLQTNKAKDAVALFDCIDSLDRPKLADALAAAAQAAGRLPRLLVQVNIGDESQKAGIARAAADHFIEDCLERFGDCLRGLMAIPPAGEDPSPYFADLAAMARRHGLATLSIGMSADFAPAIAAGATEVRIGSALFGKRA